MRLGIALLCWGAALLSLPAMIVNASYTPALTWVIWVIEVAAMVTIGIDAYFLSDRHSPWTLVVALGVYALFLLIGLISMLASYFVWYLFLFNFLIPLVAFSLSVADLLTKGRLSKAVRIAWVVTIGLYLFFQIVVMPFISYVTLDSVLSVLMLWAGILLYWIYLPLPTPEFTQTSYEASARSSHQPRTLHAEPSAFEAQLADLKQQHDAGELSDEDYEERRAKIVSMM